MMGRRLAPVDRPVYRPGHLSARPVYTGPIPRAVADAWLSRPRNLGSAGPESVPNWNELTADQQSAVARNLVTLDQCQRQRCSILDPRQAGPALGLCPIAYPDLAPAPESPCDQSCSPYWAEVWQRLGMGCDDGPPRPLGVEKKLPPAPPRVDPSVPTILNSAPKPILYPAGPYVLPSWDLPTCNRPEGCESARLEVRRARSARAAAAAGSSSAPASGWWWLLAGVVVGALVDGGKAA